MHLGPVSLFNIPHPYRVICCLGFFLSLSLVLIPFTSAQNSNTTLAPTRIFEGRSFQDGYNLAFSPDGKTILGSMYDSNQTFHTVLWDVETGAIAHTLEGNNIAVRAAFSPDSRIVLTNGGFRDPIGKLWDVQTGALLHTLRGHNTPIWSAAFSPNGTQLVTVGRDEDNLPRLWDVRSGELIRAFYGHTEAVTSVAFAPDGRTFVSSEGDDFGSSPDNKIILWDINSEQPLRIFKGHEGTVYTVAYSPDGMLIVSTGYDETVRLWNVQTGEVQHILRGHTSQIRDAAFSPDGRMLLSGGYDAVAILWDVQTGEILHTLIGHSGSISKVAYSPDGRYALTGEQHVRDNTVILWDTQTGEALYTVRHMAEDLRFGGDFTDNIFNVAFTPDSQNFFTGGQEGEALLWHIPQPGEMAQASVSIPITPTLPGSVPTPFPIYCPSSPPSRIQVGSTARVTMAAQGEVHENLRVRTTPNGERIAAMAEGTEFYVTGGYTCANDLTWWQIETPDHAIMGWVAEGVAPDDYYIEPTKN